MKCCHALTQIHGDDEETINSKQRTYKLSNNTNFIVQRDKGK